MSKEEVRLSCDYGSLGDQLCFMVAARYYAREHPEQRVVISNFPNLVASYGDDLLSSSEGCGGIQCNPEQRHRLKGASPCRNYLGTYMAELGLSCEPSPRMELPPLDPPEGLIPGKYVCLQPYSGFCGVPENQELFFSTIVDLFLSVVPDWKVVVVGHPDTRREIQNVIFDYLGGHETMLACIRHAALVLSARSASAHIASAYGVPAFIWMPPDGEEWHLDYPEWPHVRISMSEELGKMRETLAKFLGVVLSKEPGALRQYYIPSSPAQGTPTNPQ